MIVDELKKHVERIAREIDDGGQGYSEYGDEYTAYDYLSDALDIEYRVGSDGQYRSAKILVACGGPNIWIDTGSKKIIGAWWGDYAEAEYRNDCMSLDDACRELWECR